MRNSKSHVGRQFKLMPCSTSREYCGAFDLLFSRYRRLLYFVACRILCHPKEAEDAVQHCFLAASVNVPRFNVEGGFRSWLVRVLIDEAVVILRKRNNQSTTVSEHAPTPLKCSPLAGIEDAA